MRLITALLFTLAIAFPAGAQTLGIAADPCHRSPDHEAIISAFNEGLEGMKSDGPLDSILSDYGLKQGTFRPGSLAKRPGFV